MHLVQILLPLYHNDGSKIPPRPFQELEKELSSKFKGLTAYTRAPAKGLWKNGDKVKRDQIVTYEVMVPRLQRRWWKEFGAEQEITFRQKNIIIRAQRLELL